MPKRTQLEVYLAVIFLKDGRCRELELEADSQKCAEKLVWFSLSEGEQCRIHSIEIMSCEEDEAASR